MTAYHDEGGTDYERLLEDVIRNPKLLARFEPANDETLIDDLHGAFAYLKNRIKLDPPDADLLALLWRLAKAVENTGLALLIADHTESGEAVWREMLESTWLNHLEEPNHKYQDWILDLARRQANGEND